MENKIKKEKFKKALEENRVVVSGTKYNKNGWVGFRVFIQENSKLTEVDVECSYKSKKRLGYECSAWGTNRILEVILSIGAALGLEFHDIKQQWNFISES